jgi:hypothetical protein
MMVVPVNGRSLMKVPPDVKRQRRHLSRLKQVRKTHFSNSGAFYVYLVASKLPSDVE